MQYKIQEYGFLNNTGTKNLNEMGRSTPLQMGRQRLRERGLPKVTRVSSRQTGDSLRVSSVTQPLGYTSFQL